MSHALRTAQIAVLKNHPSLPPVARWSVAFAVVVTKWDQHFRTRRQLKHLSRQQLDDIGVDHTMARREATKPFWRN